MATKNLSKTKILEIFKMMDYQNIPIDTSDAEKWLYDYYGNGTAESNTVKITFNDQKAPLHLPYLSQPCVANKVFEEIKSDTRWKELDACKKSVALSKFAEEIDKSAEILSQLELLFRNILPKDTKKYGVPALKSYLQYYANYTGGIDGDQPIIARVVLCSTSMVFALAEIGFFLGAILAVGSNVIFYGEDTFSITLDYLIELANKAGIPNGTISSFYGSDQTFHNLSEFQVYKNIKIGSIEKFGTVKLLVTPHIKTSMIIFDDADLDSACDAAITAIWSCCGLLPWSVDTVLVQENVFQKFSVKLKERMKRLQFGDKPSKSDDLSFYQSANWDVALSKTIKHAKSQGIEVYQPKETKKLSPTLFIGGKVIGNKVMTEPTLQVPTGTILAFRTPKEAASLANNSQQGLAVSLWSHNSSLINEIERKLDVGTVWINCHGIIKPNVGFTTRKYEGVGYIGGLEGLCEFAELSSSSINIKEIKNSSALSATKKAQESWEKLGFKARAEKLSKYTQTLPPSSRWVKSFYKAIKELSTINSTQTIDNFNLKVYKDPVGVVVLNKIDDNLPIIVISCLLLGNAILVIEDDQVKDEIHILSKQLPAGVLGSITLGDLATIFDNLKQSVVVVGNEKPVKRSLHCQKHYDISDSSEIVKFVLRRCTISKNIWSDIGDSF